MAQTTNSLVRCRGNIHVVLRRGCDRVKFTSITRFATSHWLLLWTPNVNRNQNNCDAWRPIICTEDKLKYPYRYYTREELCRFSSVTGQKRGISVQPVSIHFSTCHGGQVEEGAWNIIAEVHWALGRGLHQRGPQLPHWPRHRFCEDKSQESGSSFCFCMQSHARMLITIQVTV